MAFTDVKNLKADRKDVARIVVNVSDSLNIFNYLAENRIVVKTKGPVRFLGMENSNPTDTGRYKNADHKAFHGRVAVYIQSLGTAGKAEIKFLSPHLKPSAIKFNILK